MRVKDDPAARLRVLMAELDMTSQQLAYLSGVSLRTISSLRRGNVVGHPNMDTVYRICEALGVHPNDIWPDR